MRWCHGLGFCSVHHRHAALCHSALRRSIERVRTVTIPPQLQTRIAPAASLDAAMRQIRSPLRLIGFEILFCNVLRCRRCISTVIDISLDTRDRRISYFQGPRLARFPPPLAAAAGTQLCPQLVGGKHVSIQGEVNRGRSHLRGAEVWRANVAHHCFHQK
jgi:hypothetical protein